MFFSLAAGGWGGVLSPLKIGATSAVPSSGRFRLLSLFLLGGALAGLPVAQGAVVVQVFVVGVGINEVVGRRVQRLKGKMESDEQRQLRSGGRPSPRTAPTSKRTVRVGTKINKRWDFFKIKTELKS